MPELTLDQALAELPDTAYGIAAYLIGQECRGQQRQTDCCPIANYLRGTGGFDDIDVDPSAVTVWTGDAVRERADTPEHIAAFIRRFDRGEWPDLVADGGEPQ
jgi:hypothetical protein